MKVESTNESVGLKKNGGAEDPLRPLSKEGYRDIMKTALFMSKFNYNIDCIFHSMKLRAKQKSEAMAETLKIDIIKIKGLAPLDEPEIIAERINNSDQFLMIFGHLPHLSKLAPLLLCGDENKLIIFFQMGWIVCLQRNKKIWAVRWIITPENISDI